jgi:hypothetical protein
MKKLTQLSAAAGLLLSFSCAQVNFAAQGTVSGLFSHTPSIVMYKAIAAPSSPSTLFSDLINGPSHLQNPRLSQ